MIYLLVNKINDMVTKHKTLFSQIFFLSLNEINLLKPSGHFYL